MRKNGGVWPTIIFTVRKITPRLPVRGNLILLVLVIALSIGPVVAFAHPGRTDSVGCHTCRTNCPNWGLSYGKYHCHRSKGVSQPKEPVRSIRDQQITVPAPEYKTPSVNKAQTQTNLNTNKPVEVEKQSFIKRFFGWLFR